MTDPIKENYTESIQTKIAAAEAPPSRDHTTTVLGGGDRHSGL